MFENVVFKNIFKDIYFYCWGYVSIFIEVVNMLFEKVFFRLKVFKKYKVFFGKEVYNDRVVN